MSDPEELHKWLLIALFETFELRKNSGGEDMWAYQTYDIKELFPILSGQSIVEFAQNKAERPFSVFFYPEIEKYIVSGTTRKGAYVMHFNLEGKRQ